MLNPAVNDALLGIDPALEIHNTTAAAASGVGARVVKALPDLPGLVLEFIDGMTLTDVHVGDPANIPRIAHACRRLHDHSGRFANDFNIFRHREAFMSLCRREGLRLPDRYEDYDTTVRAIEQAVMHHPLPAVPCHNDLLAANFLDDGSIRIVDYQLSGMNDPGFELGNVAAESDFDPDQVARLAQAYFGPETPPGWLARVRLYLVMSNVTWSLWFLVHHGLIEGGDVDFDYWEESMDKWNQAIRDIEGDDFGALLDAVRR